ncbi:ABC transporter ATP-binding protein [Mesoterricola silvestris]|uniref:ABC transporter ATP-binding protein n=1 Tax=Mesoterricola silvestris TaxID=2927979 RepID=A0AA48KAJ8_9BACT|nr:ABC transporter ATP-binding protein [Mesoterricola silvestris]BDU71573.1 ABC transporter ATP-binding protein [Mesoterricola silvestris]
MLILDGLAKTYRGAPRPALDAVDLAVGPGSFLALLGPNGAGKSTLINILSGRCRQDRGDVRVAGQPLAASNPALRALIGIVPQEIRFDYVFTVEEILRMERGFYGLRADEAHLAYLLERLSLAPKRREKVRSLSGGMQRRLMIARALVHRPRLLLLDEPTAGVDLNLRHDLYGFLRELNGDGLTILLTTHHLEEAEELCGRIVVLDEGRIVADRDREAFLAMAGDHLTLDMRTQGQARIRGLFEGKGVVTEAGAGLRVVFPRAGREPVLAALAEASPLVESFQILRPRLEDVFLELTRKEPGLA